MAQVQALANLIQAETPAQLRLAHRQNRAAEQLRPLREQLLDLSADLEAVMNFGEDVDDQADAGWRADLKEKVHRLRAQLADLAASTRRASLVRRGVKVALLGRTNVGKSSLLNRLARRDVAMVSEVPGTTRDSLELRVRLAQLPATLFDTAGLRRTQDPLEAEGMRRSLLR